MRKYLKVSLLLIVIFSVFYFLNLKHKVNNEILAFNENYQEDTKKVALTFDDGPHYKYTPMLLDELKKRDVKATFFVLGMNAETNYEIVKRMAEEGHVIGNHTYSHKNLFCLKEEAIKKEIMKTNDIIETLTGSSPKYFRPSYGNYNSNIVNLANMQVVLWNVDSLDWKSKNSNRITNRVLNKVQDGSIILMHDIYKSSVKAAIKIIDKLQSEGYKFVTVEELLK